MHVRVPRNLPSSVLNDFADLLESLAMTYRSAARAARDTEAQMAYSQRLTQIIRLSPTLVETLLAHGHELADAQAIVARNTNLSLECIQGNWRYHLRAKRWRANEERAAEVQRLAETGRRNSEIAQRLNIHPASVSRILTRQRRKQAQEARTAVKGKTAPYPALKKDPPAVSPAPSDLFVIAE